MTKKKPKPTELKSVSLGPFHYGIYRRGPTNKVEFIRPAGSKDAALQYAKSLQAKHSRSRIFVLEYEGQFVVNGAITKYLEEKK